MRQSTSFNSKLSVKRQTKLGSTQHARRTVHSAAREGVTDATRADLHELLTAALRSEQLTSSESLDLPDRTRNDLGDSDRTRNDLGSYS